MGKTTRSRKRCPRHNPISQKVRRSASNSVITPSTPEESKFNANIMEQISSSNPLTMDVLRSALDTVDEIHLHLNQISGQVPSTFNESSDADLQELISLEGKMDGIATAISALEILSNILCKEEDEDEEEDENEEEDEDFDVVAEEEEMEVGAGGGETDCKMTMETETVLRSPSFPLEEIAGLIPKILEKTKALPLPLAKSINSNPALKSLGKSHKTLRSTAFLCLQNIFEVLPLSVIEGKVSSKVVFEAMLEEAESEMELVLELTSTIRAITSSWVKDKREGNNLEHTLTRFYDSFDKVEVAARINLIQIAKNAALLSPPLLRSVATFLISKLTKREHTDIWLNAEIVDALIDLFSGDETDGLGQEVGLLKALAPLHFRWGPRKNAMDFVVVETVLENLPRFLEYKKLRYGEK